MVILLVTSPVEAFAICERRLLGVPEPLDPNRVGWAVHQLVDMMKCCFKEDWIPKFSDRVIFTLAPIITSLLLALCASQSRLGGCRPEHQFVLPDDGSLAVSVLFAGWSSNKYSLLGTCVLLRRP